MNDESLFSYIQTELHKGTPKVAIITSLRSVGWQKVDIDAAFSKIQPDSKIISISSIVIVGLLVGLFGSLTALTLLWHDRVDLNNLNEARVQEFYTKLAQGNLGFSDAGELVFPDEQKYNNEKATLVEAQKNFIEVDLKEMEIKLYEEGSPIKKYPVLSKGREGSWWETPTGSYGVLQKESNHFSSIGEVWMPWSIQFYGNFFIHGWPYHEDGTPVPQGYSGGCIRIGTADAKEIYAFAQKNMTILVKEEEPQKKFGSTSITKGSVPEGVSAESFLVINLATGEPLLEKRVDENFPIASITKLMTGVVASELIYLERSIVAKEDMLANVIAFKPSVGNRYIAFDLLYPLLMQSSNEASIMLANFLGKEKFVAQMNQKASSIGMTETTFADPSGISSLNSSTSHDVSKMLQYIYFKRHFLFDISKGIQIKPTKTITPHTLANYNEFANDSRLVGMKNGETTEALQTLASVWEFSSPTGKTPVGVIVLKSNDRMKDTQKIISWIEHSVAFK